VNSASEKIIPHIVEQHREETAHLLIQRWNLLTGSDVRLWALVRLDERLAAHVDGLRVAGKFGMELAWNAAVEQGFCGPDSFAAFLLSLEQKNVDGFMQALVETPSPAATKVAAAAYGWTSSQFLQGTIKNLLASDIPFYRQIGITACALHRVDPGAALSSATQDENIPLRARALKTAGELGRSDLLPLCEALVTHQDAAIRFWAAWSTALMGSQNSVACLGEFGLQPGPHQWRALNLLLKALPVPEAHVYLQTVSQSIQQHPTDLRALIHGASVTGDPFYIPWLIKQMDDLKLTRLAGEAFSFITGLDLAYLDLTRTPPEDFESGPNDDPDDPNVDLDPDDNLPWPDPVKIAQWWQQNQQRFQNGSRYFMGAPVTRQHCIHVLKEGYQRQRIAAAQYLCLLQPGSVLFPTSAPAWRQQRLLAKMV